MKSSRQQSDSIVLIGDIHGWLNRLTALWQRLEAHLGCAGLNAATVIFLGDYNDRGPDTKGVLDFLVALKKWRAANAQGETVFLAGNHDFAFAAYIGALPPPSVDDEVFEIAFLCNENESYEERELFSFEVEGGMHHQGRRWGAGDTYCNKATFKSYGVDFAMTKECRQSLIDAVAPEHKEFLNSLVYCYDTPVPFPPGRLVAVHAGLDARQPAEPQIQALLALDLYGETLTPFGDGRRITAISERELVLHMHPDLMGRAILVSGHHSMRTTPSEHRHIIDSTGGRARATLDAMLLPSETIVQHEDRRGPTSIPLE